MRSGWATRRSGSRCDLPEGGRPSAAAQLKSLDKADFVTTFRGKGIDAGKKSLTLTLEFRDPARTLTSEEVESEVKRTVDLLASKFQAVLRA